MNNIEYENVCDVLLKNDSMRANVTTDVGYKIIIAGTETCEVDPRDFVNKSVKDYIQKIDPSSYEDRLVHLFTDDEIKNLSQSERN